MESASWIKKKSALSFNPAQVEATLVQLSELWPSTASPLSEFVEKFPLGQAALLHILALSSVCAARVIRDPELLIWSCTEGLKSPQTIFAHFGGGKIER